MQNIYPASWLHLTGHCYVRSKFVQHHLASLFVCLFVVAVVVVTVFLIIIIVIIIVIIIIIIIIIIIYFCYNLFILLLLFLNWYKLDCKSFAELCKFFLIQIKC